MKPPGGMVQFFSVLLWQLAFYGTRGALCLLALTSKMLIEQYTSSYLVPVPSLTVLSSARGSGQWNVTTVMVDAVLVEDMCAMIRTQ